MQHGEDHDHLASEVVQDDVAGPRDDQFPCACNAPGAAQMGMERQAIDRLADTRDHAISCVRIVLSDVLTHSIEIAQGATGET